MFFYLDVQEIDLNFISGVMLPFYFLTYLSHLIYSPREQ